MIHITTWMNFKIIMMGEKHQTQKSMTSIVSIISNFWKIQSYRKWKQTVGCLRLSGSRDFLYEYKRPFLDRKALWNECGSCCISTNQYLLTESELYGMEIILQKNPAFLQNDKTSEETERYITQKISALTLERKRKLCVGFETM